MNGGSSKKIHDTTWTEQPRSWGAIVGDPSILKTPVLTACTRPLDKLEIEVRKQHESACSATGLNWLREKKQGGGSDEAPYSGPLHGRKPDHRSVDRGAARRFDSHAARPGGQGSGPHR